MRTWDQCLIQGAQKLRDDAARLASGERILRHVPTGFNQLDDTFGGLRIGIMTEILMHTGDGKSAFMRQLAEAGAQSGVGVLWFVAEDPEDATVERQFAGDTGIPTEQIGRVQLDTAELARIGTAVQSAKPWARRVLPVFGAQDVDSVLATVDETTSIGGAPLGEVLIDYAQVLAPPADMEAEIARLGIGLHDRSRARKFASAVGSQVSNTVIQRGRDGWYSFKDISRIRPSLGDTEWCKRLEKLVKAAWSVYRPGRWIREFGGEAEDDTAELHVIKANFGPLGWINLRWNGPATRFENP